MRTGTKFGALALGVLWLGCGGRMPEDPGPRGGALGACPDSPNCVSSAVDPSDEQHSIEAFAIVGDGDAAWRAAVAAVEAMPRTEIVTREGGYLHAVQTSRLMRYRDDLELLRVGNSRRIQVRSASRVGYGDMGVNRDRVEALRATLAEQGVVAAR